jgi:membrane peptidoglycan carboxypeptidase
VVNAAQAMGITSPLQPYFSIGLGAEPATPVEMARAYATLANGGYRLDSSIQQDEPMTVQSISFPNTNPKDAPKVVRNYTEPQSISWLTNGNAAIEDQMMEGVVQYGTGVSAQIPGVQIAGKTGTTENYGDAWFVGFSPDVVTAVWVGYPNKLIPMTTEFHGQTVEGGTYPALIWKAFMEKALPYMAKQPAYEKNAASALPSASVPYSIPSTVIFRQNRLELDNGNCRGADTMEFFSGTAPTAVAPCKPNEVEVPDVRGYTLAGAESRLIGQPLLETVTYAPATPGKRAGLVVSQKPVDGTLSAYQKVKLVVSRAVYGVVPRLVGMPVARARAALARLQLKARLTGGANGEVVAQSPASGVAAAPGMRVVLTVRRA